MGYSYIQLSNFILQSAIEIQNEALNKAVSSIYIRELSPVFYNDYPNSEYPELLTKQDRPFTVFTIKLFNTYICVPFYDCSQRTPTDGFAEQNGRDAERAD